jgi:hypothetical protein
MTRLRLIATAGLLLFPWFAMAGTKPIQQWIDEAPAGAVVTVPPGIYAPGATITKPLTLRLKGVRILGNTGGKAILLVRLDGGPVVIEDFTATGGGCDHENCAGVKVEGRGFAVTLRRAHIAGQVMGVLTDNRGGSLVIEDSLIEDQGQAGGALSHLVYGGIIDRLVIRNSTLRRSRALGHLLKSRAAETLVEDSRLLGLDGRHSRSIDLPCGGRLTVRHSVIQHGSRSDNADLFAVGTEPDICGAAARQGDVTLTDSWIIGDRLPRRRSQDESEEATTLFTWRASGGNRLTMTGNRIVGIERWSDGTGDAWPVSIRSAGNRIYATRAAAGLGPADIPRLP